MIQTEQVGMTTTVRGFSLADNARDFSRFCMTQSRDAIAEALHPHYETIRRMADPVAVFRPVRVQVMDRETVKIDEVTMKSRLLADKLSDCSRVCIFAVTIGKDMEESEYMEKELLKSVICTGVLRNAVDELRSYLIQELGYEDLSALNPGSLPDWPIEHNKTLFSLLDESNDRENRSGISLDEKGYMYPFHSSSGILFPHGKGYTNCSLCQLTHCPGRKCDFNETEYNRIFA